jgi:hypothetical protein
MQNLLLSSPDLSSASLLIADFGFARSLPPEALAQTLVGSPLYMAPELLAFKPYNTRADLWSVGVVLAEMLAGRPPFTGANPMDLLSHILANPWLHGTADAAALSGDAHSCGGLLPPEVADSVSPACKALLRGLLRVDPECRMQHEEFFASAWLTGAESSVGYAAALQAPPMKLSASVLSAPEAAGTGVDDGLISEVGVGPVSALMLTRNGTSFGESGLRSPVMDHTSIVTSQLSTARHPGIASMTVKGASDGHAVPEHDPSTVESAAALPYQPIPEGFTKPREDEAVTADDWTQVSSDARLLEHVARASLRAFQCAKTLHLASSCRSSSFLGNAAGAVLLSDSSPFISTACSDAASEKRRHDLSVACHVDHRLLPTSISEMDSWLEQLDAASLRAHALAYAATGAVASDCSKGFESHAWARPHADAESSCNVATPTQKLPSLCYLHPDAGSWAIWASNLQTAADASAEACIDSNAWVFIEATAQASRPS